MTSLFIRVGGTNVRIDVSEPTVAELLPDILEDLAVAEPGDIVATIARAGDDKIDLVIDGRPIHRSSDASHVIDHFMSWANHQAVSSMPEHVSLHAAAMAAPGSDRAVVAPAAPASGKSTLAVGLSARGWSYLSDEVVAIDPVTLRAVAYPKPVTLKPGTRAMVELPAERTVSERQQRWYARPVDLGGRTAATGAPVALLFARYEEGADTHRETIGVTEATLELAVNCQDQLDTAGVRLLALARLAARCQRIRLVHGSLDVLCDVADAAVTAAEIPSVRPVLEPPHIIELPPATGHSGPARHPNAVAIRLSDGVLLHDTATQRLVALDPMGGVIWELLDGERALNEVADELAATYRTDQATVLRDTEPLVTRLRENGLLQAG